MSKVLVVGFDGATWDIIRPLAAAGRLPTLAYLMRQGASGPLQSTIPPVTPAAWTSVFTGKNPGKHGIYDFQKLDPATYEFTTVRTDQHQEKTIWQLLTEAGQRSIVLDVPFTYPPQAIDGLMLTGYGTPRTPDTVFTHPPDLMRRLPPELRREVRVALPSKAFDRSQRFIDEWNEIMQGRERLFKHLITNEAWDFFMAVFSITDNMAHVFWTYVDPAHPNYERPEAQRYREAFLQAYEQCDRLLGQMMEAAGPEAVTLVLSDHGFGSVRPRQYIFRRLLQGGYVVPRRTGTGNVLGDRFMRMALDIYTRFPFLREWAKNLRPGRRSMVKRSLRRAGVMPGGNSIDYARSRVIPTNFGLRAWINEAGHFGQGIVAPEQKEALLEELEAYLLADEDPVTGERIIHATYRGREVYQGPFAGRCPDLIIEYANSFDPYTAERKMNPHIEGGHTLEGILLASGPGVQKAEVQGARLIDVGPTVLHLLGHEVPPDMDGRVISGMFSNDFLQRRPITIGEEAAHLRDVNGDAEGAAYTEEQDAEIREQLRQLGYL